MWKTPLLDGLQAILQFQQDLVGYKKQIQKVIGSSFVDYVTVSGEKVWKTSGHVLRVLFAFPSHCLPSISWRLRTRTSPKYQLIGAGSVCRLGLFGLCSL